MRVWAESRLFQLSWTKRNGNSHFQRQRRTHARIRRHRWVAFALVVIGAVNWGLVGAFGVDLVATIFGEMTMASRIVYVLVGLAGLYHVSLAFRRRLG